MFSNFIIYLYSLKQLEFIDRKLRFCEGTVFEACFMCMCQLCYRRFHAPELLAYSPSQWAVGSLRMVSIHTLSTVNIVFTKNSTVVEQLLVE